MNTLDLASKRVQLRKASGTNGGEWQGPCPDPTCGGTDRFHVWPAQNEGKGGYWCRGCGRTGDNIQFLRDFEGLSFKEACARLNIALPDRPASRRNSSPHADQAPARPEFIPERHVPPADLWQEKAEKLVAWAQGNLVQRDDIPGAAPIGVLPWLAERGISVETAVNFRLGWVQGDGLRDLYRPRKAWGLPEVLRDDGRPKALWIPRGLVIPYIVDGVIHRIRIRRPEGEPRYYVIPGSSMSSMIIGRERRAFVIVESELDAIAIAARNSFLYGAAAMGSASAKPDADTYEVLQGALQILNSLDYDAAGAKAMAWWGEHFDRCDRWPVPAGKDPGEAVKLGIDLDKWIKTGLPPALMIGGGEEGKREGRFPGVQENSQVPERRESTPRPVLPEKAGRPSDTASSSPPLAAAAVDPSVPPAVRELLELLRKNPGVKITNRADHLTILRGGKYVGGRINELVYRHIEVLDYITNNPAKVIDGENLIY